jgi:cyclophilin family peptidyl-prolyl cis-trans isomerase
MLAALLGALLALPAQDKPATNKPDKLEKSDAKTAKPKDDAVTAKDPAIVAIDKFIAKKVSSKRSDWKSSLAEPPKLKFSDKHDYFWRVETSKGRLVIRLFPDAAPMHVSSTIYLSRTGFYDGLKFPRIIQRFMAQGGSPFDTTAGDAGYKLEGEFIGDRKHDGPGILSAANTGQPKSDGSQFFLTFVATPHLDGKHTVYGQVAEGLDVLKAIEACGVERDGLPLNDPPSIVRTWIRVEAKSAKPKDASDKGGESAGR